MKWTVTLLATAVIVLLPAGPLTAEAQQAAGVYRIGFVSHPLPVSPEPATLHAFRQGLRELGYVEGKNVIVETRSAGGHQERLPELY